MIQRQFAVPVVTCLLVICFTSAAVTAEDGATPADDGWIRLFNGEDFSGWNVAEIGDHWRVVDGVIDCAAELGRGPSLKTDQEFGDFTLQVDWRIKDVKGEYPMKIILPDGSYKKDQEGKDIVVPTPNADSGVILRGAGRGQINIWCWPIGSGELWSVRNDKSAAPEVRAAAVPKVKADKPIGQWNTFSITLKGDQLNVTLNGKHVIQDATVSGLPEKGPIVLQHHGGKDPKTGKWSHAASLVQFRNIKIKPE